MGRVQQKELKQVKTIPAETPEERESELIGLAMERAEQRLRDGTASAQEIIYFLKLASEDRALEIEKLKNENLVLQAKAENYAAMKQSTELYSAALEAFRSYSGKNDENS